MSDRKQFSAKWPTNQDGHTARFWTACEQTSTLHSRRKKVNTSHCKCAEQSYWDKPALRLISAKIN